MNKLLKLLLVCLVVLNVSAQEKTLNEITSFKIKNSGAFMDANNDVDGYFFYYLVDKLKKGKREYAIKMLDNNLNDIATKSYIDDKRVHLLGSGFNNQALMFSMINLKERQFKMVSYDRKGDRKKDVLFPLEKRDIKSISDNIKSGGSRFLYPVDNKGFLFMHPKAGKKPGYGLRFISTNGGNSWEASSPADSKQILNFNPIELNEKYIIGIKSAKKNLMTKALTLSLCVYDSNSGKLLFEKPFEKDSDPRMITNAFMTEDGSIAVLGEYFKKGSKILKDSGLGLFAQILDDKGNVTLDKKISWSKEIDKMMPADSKGKKGRDYIYFHDIMRTQEGTYYCIGERYRKTVSAGGIASNLLAAAAASQGGQAQMRSMTQLTITDAVVFEFDKGFNLKDIKNFPKGKSRAPSVTDFGSPQLNAHMLNAYGAFDYLFTQVDKDRDRFYATFVDYERLKGEKNKTAFKAVIYNEGKLSEDKIYLQKDKGATHMSIMPAKLGHIALVEYNKRKKTLSLHIEKLNIE